MNINQRINEVLKSTEAALELMQMEKTFCIMSENN